MERNTVLAVVLSTLVLIIFFTVQARFFTPEQPAPQREQDQPQVTPVMPPAEQMEFTAPGVGDVYLQEFAELYYTEPLAEERIIIETDYVIATLTNRGGNLISWRLRNHDDRGEMVELIFSGANEAQAFSVAFGGIDGWQTSASLFHVNQISDHIIEFYRDFPISAAHAMAVQDGIFRLTKRYEFRQTGYMFELNILMECLQGGRVVQGFNFAGSAYTLSFGPQIGPRFTRLDPRNRIEFREYFIHGRRRQAPLNDIIDSRPTWAAIAGRYFALIAIPHIPGQYNIVFSEAAEPGLPSASRLHITRPAANTPRLTDMYRFYLGPRYHRVLETYNVAANNVFHERDMNMDDIARGARILAPLVRLLRWLLGIFVRIAPNGNYGIAIFLLTLFIKIVFFPLTKKGSMATLRMQALAPKIKELQEKHKGNPQKLQAEMANFYKTEGYNPLSGCLPMLLQMPIFIAMFQLFNTHFTLRGAMFIPGWIEDLSVPEYIWEFPEGASLPILGWTALRLLPFIYVASQLIYGKVTQMPGQQSNTQMKMMLYVMPIVFFFILYNMPSGLLVYWIFSNILTLVQQMIINKFIMKKRIQNEPQQPVIAPTGKKKNKIRR